MGLNKRLFQFFKAQLSQQSGMAILLVMTAIALLTFLLADFTYEMKLNKIKAYNLQDQSQARLNAEAGLRFALAKLRIYQKAMNEIEKQKQLKEMFKLGELEAVVTMPFIFPIPMPPKVGAIQREAIETFSKNILLSGELNLQIAPVKGFFNPNNLRMSLKQRDNNITGSNGQTEETTPEAFLQKELVNLVKTAVDAKKEADEEFEMLYGNLEPELLIKELRFFVSEPDSYDDPSVQDFENAYSEKGITPKHAPMTSLDELYLLVGWDDAIIDLVKEKLSVHETAFIAINEITQEQLKALFPTITPEQSEEFFKTRDGDAALRVDPTPFTTIEDFQRLVINELAIVDQATYEQRIKQFEKAGIKLGLSGKLYKVTSIGKAGNAQYSLVAYVDMPIKPVPPPPPANDPNNPNNPNPNDPNEDDPNNPPANPNGGQNNNANKEPPPMQLMAPRVVELKHE